MKITTFFLNGSTQVTNVSEKFFKTDRGSVISSLEAEQKAKALAQDVAQEQYYNYHLDWNRMELLPMN